MEKSTKLTAIFLFCSVFAIRAQAQSNTTAKGIVYSVGVESGISSGNFNNAYRWNIGGSVEADIPLLTNVFATVNAGNFNFSGKNNINGTGVSAGDIHLLPATAGIKYFVIPDWYIQGGPGLPLP